MFVMILYGWREIVRVWFSLLQGLFTGIMQLGIFGKLVQILIVFWKGYGVRFRRNFLLFFGRNQDLLKLSGRDVDIFLFFKIFVLSKENVIKIMNLKFKYFNRVFFSFV